jgi:hypothetical protein
MSRYRRRPAAKYVSDKLGTPVSDRTFEALPIPYKVIAGKAIYDEPDLDAYVAAQLNAPTRIKGKPVADTDSSNNSTANTDAA